MRIKYSVLMSVYKKEKSVYLRQSIQSMLNQTIQPAEFILIEDGPLTDELYREIDYFVKQHKNLFTIIKLKKNLGLGPALAIGVKKARYEYIARMDSDDISIPTRIEFELAEFKKDRSLALVGSNVDEFEGSIDNIISHVLLPENNIDIIKFNKKRAPFRHPSIIFKKDVILKVGNYRKYNLFEDYDLYNRIIINGYKCKNIQQVLVYMRTDKNFYRRRSGIKYALIMTKFRWGQYMNGTTNFLEFFLFTSCHFFVCVIPNNIRKLIYKKLLRK